MVKSGDDLKREFDIDENNQGQRLGTGQRDQQTLKMKSKRDHKHYALKFLKVEDNKKIQESDRKDILLLLKYNHPNILKYHEIFQYQHGNYESTKTYWLTVKSELAETSLAQEIDNRIAEGYRFTDLEIVFMINECLSALLYLREHRINHLAIKPQNLLINEYKELKLSDFSMSRLRKENSGSMTFLSISQTVTDFSDPELLRAQSEGSSYKQLAPEKSDVFSLGLCMLQAARLLDENEMKGLNVNMNNLEKELDQVDSIFLKYLFAKMLNFDQVNRCSLDQLRDLIYTGKGMKPDENKPIRVKDPQELVNKKMDN